MTGESMTNSDFPLSLVPLTIWWLPSGAVSPNAPRYFTVRGRTFHD